MVPELRRAYRVDSPKQSTRLRTRVAGAWTRLGPDGSPLGRLHAARRIDGHLDTSALCGYKIPARQLSARPHPVFETDHAKACPICVAEAEDMP